MKAFLLLLLAIGTYLGLSVLKCEDEHAEATSGVYKIKSGE